MITPILAVSLVIIAAVLMLTFVKIEQNMQKEEYDEKLLD
jgi:hypothetical protein